MAENVLAMTLRMRNTAVRTARDLRHEVDRTGTSAQAMGTKFGHAVKASRTSVQGLIGSFVSLKTIIVATFAYRAIQRFGRFLNSLTALYKEQEISTRLLNEALAGWGNYSVQMTNKLQKQAAAMQNLVNVDNEEIESMMGLLASYGMTGEEVSKVIGLTIDFAKAKRIELKAAVDLVGKAFVGYTGTLSRYGIILERGLSNEEKYVAALKKLNAFVGTAEGITKNYAGSVGILNKQYEDMKKSMGAVIARAIEQSGILDMLSNAVQGTYEWFVKWEPLLSSIAAKGLTDVSNKLKEILVILKEGDFVRWMATLSNVTTIAARAFMIWYRAVREGFNVLAQMIDIMVDFPSVMPYKIFTVGAKEHAKAVEDLRKKYSAFWDSVLEGRYKVRDLNEETIKNMKKDFKDLHEIWKAETGKEYLENLKNRLEGVNAALRVHADATREAVRNRQRQNEVTAETIKLTESMARQFALATRVEQEQIKYMLEKARIITPLEAGRLTEPERKLISRFNVLKETYKNLLTEYTAKSIGTEFEPGKIGDSLKQLEDSIQTLNTRVLGFGGKTPPAQQPSDKTLTTALTETFPKLIRDLYNIRILEDTDIQHRTLPFPTIREIVQEVRSLIEIPERIDAKTTQVDIEVDLTDRAAKYLQVRTMTETRERNRNVERIAG